MGKAWTNAELTTLGEMRAINCDLSEMSERLGRTRKAVSAKVAYLNLTPEMKRKRQQTDRARAHSWVRPKKPKKERYESQIWSAQEIELLLSLRNQQRKGWKEIAAVMGYTVAKVCSKYSYVTLGPVPRESAKGIIPIPEEVSIDRHRRMMSGPRDLTAALCGDPPVGWSALERRA